MVRFLYADEPETAPSEPKEKKIEPEPKEKFDLNKIEFPKTNKTLITSHFITSDAIRTAYFLLSGKSSRKRIDQIKKDLIELLSK